MFYTTQPHCLLAFCMATLCTGMPLFKISNIKIIIIVTKGNKHPGPLPPNCLNPCIVDVSIRRVKGSNQGCAYFCLAADSSSKLSSFRIDPSISEAKDSLMWEKTRYNSTQSSKQTHVVNMTTMPISLLSPLALIKQVQMTVNEF